MDWKKQFSNVLALLTHYLEQKQQWSWKVIHFLSPQELLKSTDITLWNPTDQSLEDIIQTVLDKSVATQHPLFFNQLYAWADPIGIIGDRVATVLNTSMATYEIAPLFTLMETELYSTLAKMIGWENHDGLMCAWGSMLNQYAIQLARHRVFPESNKTWIYWCKPMHIYTSDQAHYSITKAAQLLWIGSNNVISIPTSDNGSMIVEKLQEAILQSKKNGAIPLMINGTSWTTVLWAYDSLDEIAAVAKKYAIWFHVDMIRWGSVFLSETHKHRINWIQKADSFWRNPHKMLGAPLQCSIFLTQHIALLWTCNVLKAQYLFQQDKGYDIWCDTGDKYVQCGRKVDVLKIWLMWKVYGTAWFADRLDTAFTNAHYLAERINQSDRFYCIQEPTCTNICFWYLPTWIDKKTFDHKQIDNATHNQLHSLTARMKQRMLEDGEMMISYQTNKWLPNFFRMIIVNPIVTKEHLDYVLAYLEKIWKELE
jgi:glutamate/tyrosine decarboxylase-like PLP-dependent enzyme